MTDIQSISISQRQLDENGLVLCWLIGEGKWVKRFPIDAKEGIAAGTMNMIGPEDQPSPAKQDQAEDHEMAFAAMSKTRLRSLCVQHGVQHGGADTKASLIKRLISQSIIPE